MVLIAEWYCLISGQIHPSSQIFAQTTKKKDVHLLLVDFECFIAAALVSFFLLCFFECTDLIVWHLRDEVNCNLHTLKSNHLFYGVTELMNIKGCCDCYLPLFTALVIWLLFLIRLFLLLKCCVWFIGRELCGAWWNYLVDICLVWKVFKNFFFSSQSLCKMNRTITIQFYIRIGAKKKHVLVTNANDSLRVFCYEHSHNNIWKKNRLQSKQNVHPLFYFKLNAPYHLKIPLSS